MAAPRRIFNPFPHLSTDNFTEKSFAGTQKHNILGTNLDVFSPQTTIWYWHQKIKVSKNIDCKFGHQVVHLICNTIGKNSFDELILSTILVISVSSYLHTRAVVEERRGVHQPVDYKLLPLPNALRKSKIHIFYLLVHHHDHIHLLSFASLFWKDVYKLCILQKNENSEQHWNVSLNLYLDKQIIGESLAG